MERLLPRGWMAFPFEVKRVCHFYEKLLLGFGSSAECGQPCFEGDVFIRWIIQQKSS